MLRDPEFGVVRLRAFGTYGIRVVDPAEFMKKIVGTDGCYTTDEIEGQLRSMLVSSFTGMLATASVAALDLAANYRAIGDKARKEMEEDFQGWGMNLTRFVIENISLPPDVEKALDTKTQMGIVGDMGRFTQFQAANAIPEAARSGGAGEVMGMGAGFAIGQQMANAMASSMAQTGQPQPSVPQASNQAQGKFCNQCGSGLALNAKFCPECGASQQANCPNCGEKAEAADKFCKECGHKLK
jgi:membrane protease subunit (stomatin/prohibitin family)